LQSIQAKKQCCSKENPTGYLELQTAHTSNSNTKLKLELEMQGTRIWTIFPRCSLCNNPHTTL